MIVAGHQPNYLPWLGFFYKFAHCDVFVIDDEAQFTRHNYQNRTRVKTRHGPIWLTQPVRHVGHFRSTATVEFAPGIDWRRQHLNLLWHNYARSAQREAFDLCREWLAAGSNRYMAETNIEIIAAVARTLGLRAEIVLVSALGGIGGVTKGERVTQICRRLGAGTYLSGQGARKYQDQADFDEHGIELIYSDFAQLEYDQLWGEFCPALSVLDALLNLGPAGTAALLQDPVPELTAAAAPPNRHAVLAAAAA
jgi:hypothetical protein